MSVLEAELMVDRAMQFDEYRALLFSIAYRMLGSVMDAEDMVQEAYLRWEAADPGEIKYPKAYLSTIVTRLSIDYLRSARIRRERYVGPWLPEPLVAGLTPEAGDHLAMSESLTMAFLVLLESLSPVERAVFLLREVFEYDYEEVGHMVGKSEAACRQIVSRARKRIADERPRFDVTPADGQRLVEGFMEIVDRGDFEALVGMLAEDITLWSDGGGIVTAATHPVYGPANVATFLLGSIRRLVPSDLDARVQVVNGQPSIVNYRDGQPHSVLTFDFSKRRIDAIRIIVNPDKLRRIPPLR